MTNLPAARRGRDLSGVFHPSAIALVGASQNPDRLTGRPLPILKRHGFPGRIYPVNPKYAEIDGLTCYPDVASIREDVDMALLMMPAPAVPETLRQCGEAGIKNAVIISSGFEEADGAAELTTELREVAAKYEINVVGPNCEGVWSVPYRTILTFGSAALYGSIIDGPVSVLSQSGSIGGSTVVNLNRRGIGCRYFVSLGNETVLGALDYLDYLVDEGGTRVVLMFLEGIRDGARLLDIAARAHDKGMDIVALKTGSSAAGQKAAASHTGKISSPRDVYSSIFRQCGIIEVTTINDLTEAADILTGRPLAAVTSHPRTGVGVIAPGGARGVIADESERCGVPFAEFSAHTEATLRARIPSYGSVDNPVDATGQVLTQKGMFEEVIGAVARDESTEALLIQYSNRGLQRIEEIRELFGAPGLVPDTKPVVVGFLGDADALGAAQRAAFRDAGLIAALNPETAVKYLGWLYQSREARSRTVTVDGLSVADADARTVRGSSAGTALRTWREQAALLAAAGVPTPAWAVAHDSTEVADALTTLQFPLAVKALSEDVDHKTDLGLVHLDLATADEVQKSVGGMLSRSDIALSGVLLQEMAPHGYELLASVRDDPDFGPVLTVGAGGSLVELLKDVAHVLIPCGESDLREALLRTRFGALLSGVRGRPPGDVDALVHALASLSRTYLGLADPPRELEVNPLVVLARGEGVLALDILTT